MSARWMTVVAITLAGLLASAQAGTVVSAGSVNWDAGATWGGTAPASASAVVM